MGSSITLTKETNEYNDLLEQIKQLKLNVAALIVEKDDLELNECRKLSAEYDQKIGHLELEITRYNLEIERLRSVIENMQAAVNRGQAVSREKAEEAADEKFKDFYEDLEKHAEKVKEDQEFAKKRQEQDQENYEYESYEDDEEIDWDKFFEDMGKFADFFDNFFRGFEQGYEGDGNDDSATDYDKGGSAKKNVNPNKELRMLYLKVMKALHPDNKPDRTERDDQLLLEAKEAFETGNLKKLREIAEMIEDDDVENRFADNPEGIEELRRLLQQLIEQKAALEKSIERIKSSFPYNMKQFLADNEAVAARQKELKGIIDSCKNTIDVLNQRIEQLQKEMDMVAGD